MTTVLIHLGAVLIAVAVGAPQPATPSPGPEPRQKQTPPSLDELLGLVDDTDNAAEQAARQNDRELQRRLSDVELGDAFEVALEKMQISADLLDIERDSGLGTQRVQQDILAKLDQLIEAAKQQQQQRSSSRSASSSPGTQPQRQQQANRASDGENRGQVNPPARQEGPLMPGGAGDASTWGALPARVREALSQGQTGRFSALYRSLTEAYYRRLAEEAGR